MSVGHSPSSASQQAVFVISFRTFFIMPLWTFDGPPDLGLSRSPSMPPSRQRRCHLTSHDLTLLRRSAAPVTYILFR